MTEITEEKAIEVYNKHHLEAENYLAQYGDDGISRNIGVTQSYNHMSEQAPLFMWFHAATTGSFQVGEALQLTQNPLVQSCHSTQTMFEGLSWGNQAIHNNMFALFHTYQELGLEGLTFLTSKVEPGVQPLLSDKGFQGFSIYDGLVNASEQIAKDFSAESGGAFISPNDPAVLAQLYSDPENFEASKVSSILVTTHEQEFVSPMYNMTFFPNGPTVGEVMDDKGFINSLANKYAEINHVSGAQIYDTWISMLPYTFSSHEERMKYFESVFDVFYDLASEENGFLMLSVQRHGYVDGLDIDFIPYNTDYQSEAFSGHGDSIIDVADAYPSYLVPYPGIIENWQEPSLEIVPSIIITAELDIFPSEAQPAKIAENTELEVSFSINLSEHNLGLAHASLEDLINDPSYLVTDAGDGFVYYVNTSLPWFNNGQSYFYSDNDVFLSFDAWGEARGLVFPLLYNTETHQPLTMPLFINQPFEPLDSIDILMNNPELFNTPGDPEYDWGAYNRGVLQQYYFMADAGQIMVNSMNNSVMNQTLNLHDVLSGNDGIFQVTLNGVGVSDYHLDDTVMSYSGLGANSVPSSMSADISLSEDGDYLLNITSYYNTGECGISYEYEFAS